MPGHPSTLVGNALVLSALWAGVAPTIGLAADYENDVRPILKRRCLKCHNLGEREADLDLSSFDGLMLGSHSGPVLSPGDPEDSFLWLTISHIEEPFMPPNDDPIPEEERRVIRDWIAGGAVREGEPESPPFILTTDPAPEPLTVDASAASTITALASDWERGWFAHATGQGVRLSQTSVLDDARVLPFQGDLIHDLRFSVDGATLWAAGGIAGESGLVTQWDLSSGAILSTYGDELDTVLAMDVTRDQRWLAFGGPDRMVRLLNLPSAEPTPIKIRKHTDFVLDLAFSPDGLLLASADRAGNLFVWVTETQELFAALRGKIGAVEALVWNEASDHLSATGSNGEIVTWDLRALETPKRQWLAHEGGALDLQLGPNDTLLSAGRDGWVRLWRRDATPLEAWDCDSMLPTQAQLVYRDASWHVAAGNLEGRIEWYKVSRLAPPQVFEPGRMAQGNTVESQERQRLEAQLDAIRNAYRAFREAQATVETLRSELRTIESRVDQWTTVQVGLQQAKTALEALRSTDEDERALDTLVLAKLASERAQAILDGQEDNQSAVLQQLAEAERNRESAQAVWRTLMDAIEDDSPGALSDASLKD